MHNYVQTSVMVKKQFAAAALVVSLLYTGVGSRQPVHDSVNKMKAES